LVVTVQRSFPVEKRTVRKVRPPSLPGNLGELFLPTVQEHRIRTIFRFVCFHE
jgi:hypothetical protein